MSLQLLLAVAAVTVGSRVLALAVLPPPGGAFADVVQRLPAPLFTLAAGIGGFVAASLIW